MFQKPCAWEPSVSNLVIAKGLTAMTWNLFRWNPKPNRRRSAHHPQLRPYLEQLESRNLLTTLPSGFTETTVVSGLSNPTNMELAADGRLFALEQGGAAS